MKVLIYLHVCFWEIHFAEAIEIILAHLKDSDDVYVLRCKGALSSCPANPNHERHVCNACIEIANNALELIDFPMTRQYTLNFCPNNLSGLDVIFSDVDEMKSFCERGVPHGMLAASQLIDDLQDCYPDTVRHSKKAQSLIGLSMHLFNHAKAIIQAVRPDLVYVWNGRRCSDGPIIHAAETLGVDYATFISGGKYNTYAVFKNGAIHDLEYQKTLLKKLCEREVATNIIFEAEKFYSEQRYGGGNYPGYIHFAKDFEQNCIRKRQNSGRLLTIFTSSFWEIAASSEWKIGSLYQDLYDGLVNILSDDRKSSNIEIIVRWHPNLRNISRNANELSRLLEITEKFAERARFIMPWENANSYELVEESEKILSFGSTIGIEAVFYGKPSILCGRAIFEDSGSCYVPNSHSQLIEMINAKLEPKNKEGAMRYGYYRKSYGQQRYRYLSRSGDGRFMYKGTLIYRLSTMYMIKELPGRVSRKIKRLIG